MTTELALQAMEGPTPAGELRLGVDFGDVQVMD
jgi:hypothetical protein